MTHLSSPGNTDAVSGYRRVVGRWQLFGLSLNDVVGSGVYLLPAGAAMLLGPASVWAVLLAGGAVALLVMCYAQAASYFDQPGGGYLYAREAFGDFVGFEVGWMLLLTRLSAAAALAKGLAMAITPFWPAAGGGGGELFVIAGSLILLAGVKCDWGALCGQHGGRTGSEQAAAVAAVHRHWLVPCRLVDGTAFLWLRPAGRHPSA